MSTPSRLTAVVAPGSRSVATCAARSGGVRGALAVSALACAGVWGCSPSQYGYAKVYEPHGAEEAAAETAVEYDPVMANRRPAEWEGKKVSLFGVVMERRGKQEDVDLKLGMRQLQPRNLCETDDNETCRVTVSDHVFATVHATAKLSPEDALGQKGVAPGSLVRVIGVLEPEVSAVDGLPVVKAEYYRHWPRNYYVTTRARQYMRR